jgi:hypothetical protein
MSAMLEAHESLPSSLSTATPTSSRQLRRMHAEHHAYLTHSAVRVAFALDIPSDASPAFDVCVDGAPADLSSTRSPYAALGATQAPSYLSLPAPPPGGERKGGLEWKVRLCLLVSVTPEAGAGEQGGKKEQRTRQLVRDGLPGEWGSAYRAAPGISPLTKSPGGAAPAVQRQGWAAWAASLIASTDEKSFHDGDDMDEEAMGGDDAKAAAEAGDVGGGEEGWKEIGVERVECEVPLSVWPGNTAFKATDVVFDV